jgi:hypothetical protein
MNTLAMILLKCPTCPAQLSPEAVTAMAAAFGARIARTCEALDGSETYIYLELDHAPAQPGFATAVAGKAKELLPANVQAIAMTRVAELAGVSTGQVAPFFYTVEITASAEHMPAVSGWYDGEHMPDLASVPGTVRARRFLSHGEEPTSYACYDITTSTIRETPEWKSKLGTEWSNRVRPHFVNLKRNMFHARPVKEFTAA